MALRKDVVLDRIEILRDGTIQVRLSSEIYDDNELVGERYSRTVYTPLTDPASIPNAKVRRICQFIWTPEVIAAYTAALPPVGV
jgi:hypothetical protein